MSAFTPRVDITIFPRVNLYKTFKSRAIRRDLNGRIYGNYGGVGIDNTERYPISEGATCLADQTLPIDLGPLVTTATSGLFDLRKSCGSPAVTDLNPLT